MHVARTGAHKIAYEILVGKHGRRRTLEDIKTKRSIATAPTDCTPQGRLAASG
jgi:hypothetical protein